jgi:Cdc6-like AAA superfamily ATPase
MIGRIVQSEFFDILNQLESLAIIHLQIKKRNNKTETMVTLNVNPEEVLEAVSHVPIIKDILENADEAIQGPKK